MKKIFVLTAFILTGSISTAQTFPLMWHGNANTTTGPTWRAGVTGIGNSNNNLRPVNIPNCQLEVFTNDGSGLGVTETGGNEAAFTLRNANPPIGGPENAWILTTRINGNFTIGKEWNPDNAISITPAGNIGIGNNPIANSRLTIGQNLAINKVLNLVNTSSPGSPYDLFNVYGDGKAEIRSNNGIPLSVASLSGSFYNFQLRQSGGRVGMWACNAVLSYALGIDNSGIGHIWGDINLPQPNDILSFSHTGTYPQVWIGGKQITPSAHTDFRLAVDGKVVATEVIVTQQNWADYVFDKAYKIPTLSEVEKYYQTNGHLIDVPSATEVANTGVSVGEMNKILLQKIEELTIYVVNQQKQIDEQKKQIEILKNNK